MPSPLESLASHGFTIVQAGLTSSAAEQLRLDLEQTLGALADDRVALKQRGSIYGARNLLQACPAVAAAWRTSVLVELLQQVLGRDFGLVRGLYFDKPPETTWSLPWHQDRTIAVQDNQIPSAHFQRPTIKAGVPHVEAPEAILMRMLTLRIHLDEVNDENGPLQVLPGTHRELLEAFTPGEPAVIHAQPGDVLAMRPLLAHCSGTSRPGTTRHRRIVHLEFAADRDLPDGYSWQMFLT